MDIYVTFIKNYQGTVKSASKGVPLPDVGMSGMKCGKVVVLLVGNMSFLAINFLMVKARNESVYDGPPSPVDYVWLLFWILYQDMLVCLDYNFQP